MKIILFGTSDFAIPSLCELNKFHEIAAVITKKDKPRGRHLQAGPSAVKAKAKELKLSIHSIEGTPIKKSVEKLKVFGADLFVVIAYGQILAPEILSIPKSYTIGLHASLLPKYRGASPINWAVLNGEKETGVSVFKLNEKMDAGDVIAQEAVEILDSDNALALSQKLSEIGARLLLGTIEGIKNNKVRLTPQSEEEATFAPMLSKKDGIIDWNRSATEIHNRVRGLFGWPGTFSKLEGKVIKIWLTEITDADMSVQEKPGRILKADSEGLLVSCGQGSLRIRQLQAEGARRMSAGEYLHGHRVAEGDFFL